MKFLKKLVAVVTMVSVLSMGFTAFAEESASVGFEKAGLECNLKLGEPAVYYSIAYDEDIPIYAYVTVVSDEIIPSSDVLQAKPGYEWRRVTVQIISDDPDVWALGIMTSTSTEDYYDFVYHDATCVYNADTDRTTFSTVKDGVVYPECEQFVSYGEWINDYDLETMGQIRDYYFCIPVGYDGMVISLRDASIPWLEGQYICDVADENTLFYRLQ